MLYAWRGECVGCTPHAAASYRVLGLHPDKVWPTIEAWRRANLGPDYDKYFGEHPPKKPVQSVRDEGLRKQLVAGERPERGIGPIKQTARNPVSAPPVMRALPAKEGAMTMATAETAYRNPASEPSRKRRNALSANQVRRLLECADYSRVAKARIFRGPGKSMLDGQRRYHREHLRSALLNIWKGSTQPFGVQILLFKAVENFAADANKCERAMRYILRTLEDPQCPILRVHKKANTVRRPTTYELNLELLEQLQYPVRGFKAHTQAQIESAPALTADETRQVVQISVSAVKPAPTSSPPKSESPPKLAGKLTRDEKAAIVNRVRELVRPLQKESETLPPELDDPTLSLRWHRVLSVLEGKINPHSFDTWFKPTRASHARDGVLFIRVPAAEFCHVEAKHSALLRDALAELHLPYKGVQFFAPEKEAKAVPAMTIDAALVKACAELSTERRSFSVEDARQALKIAELNRR